MAALLRLDEKLLRAIQLGHLRAAARRMWKRKSLAAHDDALASGDPSWGIRAADIAARPRSPMTHSMCMSGVDTLVVHPGSVDWPVP